MYKTELLHDYVLCTSCATCAYPVWNVSDAESVRFRDSEVRVRISEGFSIGSSLAGIDTLHPLGTFEC